jgi:hypothetical protein
MYGRNHSPPQTGEKAQREMLEAFLCVVSVCTLRLCGELHLLYTQLKFALMMMIMRVCMMIMRGVGIDDWTTLCGRSLEVFFQPGGDLF